MHTQFRSVVASILAVTMALPAFGAPRPRRRPAAAPSAATQQPSSCDGLQSSAGKFSSNHQKREKLNNNFCQQGNLEKAIEQIRIGLKNCEDLSKYTKGNSHHVNPDIFFPDLRARAKKACEVHKSYTDTAKALCDQYGKAAEHVRLTNDVALSTGEYSTQAGDFNKVAQMHQDAVRRYNLFAASMKQQNDIINKNLQGLDGGDASKNTPAKDKVFEEAVSRIRYQINSLTGEMRKQASTAGEMNRAAVAAASGDQGMIRFNTRADANKFWTSLVNCEAVVKPESQKGALDRLNTVYQTTLAKSLGQAKVESADLAEQFKKQAEEHAANRKANEDTARYLNRAESGPIGQRQIAEEGRRDRPVIGGMPTPSETASIQMGENYLKTKSAAEVDQFLTRSHSNKPGWNVSTLPMGEETYKVYRYNTTRGPQVIYVRQPK